MDIEIYRAKEKALTFNKTEKFKGLSIRVN